MSSKTYCAAAVVLLRRLQRRHFTDPFISATSAYSQGTVAFEPMLHLRIAALRTGRAQPTTCWHLLGSLFLRLAIQLVHLFASSASI